MLPENTTAGLLADLRQLIHQSQRRAVAAVNAELTLLLYWTVGNPTPRIHLPTQTRRAGRAEKIPAAPGLQRCLVICIENAESATRWVERVQKIGFSIHIQSVAPRFHVSPSATCPSNVSPKTENDNTLGNLESHDLTESRDIATV